MNHNALIGFSGFVGSTLRKQTHFSSIYRSTNIEEINGKIFDTVVCAAAPAQKWIANRDPEKDWNNIKKLMEQLKTITCKKFILISTVDVFKQPLQINESTPIDEDGLHAYGYHRRQLEKFIEVQFECHLIIRLPGLVGPGLRKNIIFDFLNKNNLSSIDSRGVFQFYPMVNLWSDIQIALQAKLALVHLTASPISIADVALLGFGLSFTNVLENKLAVYDMQTQYAPLFGVKGVHQYSIRETIQAIRAYAQSEPITKMEVVP